MKKSDLKKIIKDIVNEQYDYGIGDEPNIGLGSSGMGTGYTGASTWDYNDYMNWANGFESTLFTVYMNSGWNLDKACNFLNSRFNILMGKFNSAGAKWKNQLASKLYHIYYLMSIWGCPLPNINEQRSDRNFMSFVPPEAKPIIEARVQAFVREIEEAKRADGESDTIDQIRANSDSDLDIERDIRMVNDMGRENDDMMNEKTEGCPPGFVGMPPNCVPVIKPIGGADRMKMDSDEVVDSEFIKTQRAAASKPHPMDKTNPEFINRARKLYFQYLDGLQIAESTVMKEAFPWGAFIRTLGRFDIGANDPMQGYVPPVSYSKPTTPGRQLNMREIKEIVSKTIKKKKNNINEQATEYDYINAINYTCANPGNNACNILTVGNPTPFQSWFAMAPGGMSFKIAMKASQGRACKFINNRLSKMNNKLLGNLGPDHEALIRFKKDFFEKKLIQFNHQC